MEKMKVEKVYFKVLYDNVDITKDISRHLESFTYTDHLEEADTLDIQLEDADQNWQDGWYPDKGAKITAEIGIIGGPVIQCGIFDIDEIELLGPPDKVNIRCIAAGFKNGSKRTNKNHVHENKTLREIINTIASAAGYSIVGNISNIRINRYVQRQKNDLKTLRRLAREYGYVFNIRDKSLVFIRTKDLVDTTPIVTLKKSDLLLYSIKDTSTGLYKSATVKFHDPETGDVVSYSANSGNNDTDDTLELNLKASNASQAKEMAEAALFNANIRKKTGTITTKGRIELLSGNLIWLEGLGKLSTQYLIESAAHTITSDGGWTVDAEIISSK